MNNILVSTDNFEVSAESSTSSLASWSFIITKQSAFEINATVADIQNYAPRFS